MRIGHARPSSALVRQSPLVHGRFSFQDEAAGSSPARPTTPGVDLRGRSPVVSFNGGCFREGLRTAVLERIPALLSSEDFGSSVRREAHGQVSWGGLDYAVVGAQERAGVPQNYVEG